MKYSTLLASLVVSLSLAFGATPPTGRYKVIVDALNSLEAQHPDLAHVFSIGTNDDGVELMALRISTSPKAVDQHKIGHIMVATHHGNESAAPQFAMAFINQLIRRYRGTEFWRTDLAQIEWTVLPVLNVSGYNLDERHEHGLDPNRDYASPCLSVAGGKLKSVHTITDFLKTRIFSGNVTVHGYHGSMTYPWGLYTDQTHTLDHNLFHSVLAKAAEVNGYQVGTAADVVYPANGCYEDYTYWKHGHWSLLLELKSGDTEDITSTVGAIAAFYDQLNASPSIKNQFVGGCTRDDGRGMRWE